jgi:hypothetical protein
MTLDEWRATRAACTTDEGHAAYEYGPGRNVILIYHSNTHQLYQLDWNGETQYSPDLLLLETYLYDRATREDLL